MHGIAMTKAYLVLLEPDDLKNFLMSEESLFFMASLHEVVDVHVTVHDNMYTCALNWCNSALDFKS